jgi:SAM-dependent methyltransferase
MIVFTQDASSGHEYDKVVDWERRMAREAPFFKALFDEVGVSDLVDVGCGTGRHAAEFASWGLGVTGVDPDEGMLEQAERHVRDRGVSVRLLQGGFGELGRLVDGPVDAVVCLGNAFQHVEGAEGLASALEDMASVLRSGGVLVLHYLNHDRLLANRPRVMDTRFRETQEGDRVFLKLLDYGVDENGEDEILFDFIVLRRDDEGSWQAEGRSSSHRALRLGDVRHTAEKAGFEDVRLYGSHDRRELDAAEDESVVLVARRR